MQESEFDGQRIGVISKSWSCAEAYHLCSVRVTWADAEFGDSASPSPNGRQYMRTMCTLRAYDKGTLMGNEDVCVSRQCFTRRLTVGIAKGMPTVTYGQKKPTGSRWVYCGFTPVGLKPIMVTDLGFVQLPFV